MQHIGRRTICTLALVGCLAAPTMSMGQTVFSYSATDHQVIELAKSGSVTIAVNTLVVIQDSPTAPRIQGPTRQFLVQFRPPQGISPQILLASVDKNSVEMQIVRSNLDGELEASVLIPLSAGDSPELKIDWSTKDLGGFQTTASPKLPDREIIQQLSATRQPLRVPDLAGKLSRGNAGDSKHRFSYP